MCATGMLRAIETRYNGYRFRSRLEARWAVFFDTLGIKYQYEVEGFDLDGLWYLPDFYLPIQNYWIEIKPSLTGKPWEEWPGHPMFDWLERQIDPPWDFGFYLIVGEPWVDPGQVRTFHSYETPGVILSWAWNSESFSYMCFPYADNNYYWCECPTCGYIGLEYDGRAYRLPCRCKHAGDKGYNNGTPRLIAAYQAARRARF